MIGLAGLSEELESHEECFGENENGDPSSNRDGDDQHRVFLFFVRILIHALCESKDSYRHNRL